MALMFPRIARNFAKAGYYPTDEASLERVLLALQPASSGTMSVLDPCAGEGVAIAEVAHALGRQHTRAFAVEFDPERATHAKKMVDHCLHADLMDTIISRQSFGLIWFNPPYGDLARDINGNYGYQGRGRARIEKLFYQRMLPLQQYDGILVLILPSYSLDSEQVDWLTHHYTDLRVFRTVERQFKQVVVFGRRVRQREIVPNEAKTARALLTQIGQAQIEAEELPEIWPFTPYVVPAAAQEPEHFYRVTLEPGQLAAEIKRLKGLWPSLTMQLGATQRVPRAPARALSPWHLALALAAGAVSGIVRSKSGRVFIVKGDTYKTKTTKMEYTERADGSVAETRILLDRFVPVIRAWDMTPGSEHFGEVLTIS